MLLTARAAIDVPAEEGRHLIHYAAVEGHAGVVSLLLAAGADVNQPDEARWTALHYAACCGESDLVLVLLDAGADMACRTSDGYGATPLHLAVISTLTDTVGFHPPFCNGA